MVLHSWTRRSHQPNNESSHDREFSSRQRFVRTEQLSTALLFHLQTPAMAVRLSCQSFGTTLAFAILRFRSGTPLSKVLRRNGPYSSPPALIVSRPSLAGNNTTSSRGLERDSRENK